MLGKRDEKMQYLHDELNIRYIKLHFTAEVLEDTVLPKYKASALRGGMGEMMLRANCIRDRKCDFCDFRSECLAQKALYPVLIKLPSFMKGDDGIGYVIACEDYKEEFYKGDSFHFQIILFGKLLCCFNLYMQALYALGMEGLGKYRGRFHITSVTNSKKEILLDQNGNIYMENYKIQTVKDHVEYRKKQLMHNGLERRIRFRAPFSVKYKGEMLQQFHMEAILLACARRIYALDCLEELDLPQYRLNLDDIPEIKEQKVYKDRVPRYSGRTEKKMRWEGIHGEIFLDSLTEEQVTLLLAGELMHIGKHTTFGFGRFHVF